MADQVRLGPDEHETAIKDMKAGETGFTAQSSLYSDGWNNDYLEINKRMGVSKLPNEIECVKITLNDDSTVAADASHCHPGGQIRLWSRFDIGNEYPVVEYIRPVIVNPEQK